MTTGTAGLIPADPAAPEHSWPNCWPRHDGLELLAITSAIPCARARMREVLREWGLGGLADDAESVLAELTANALGAIERQVSEEGAERGTVRLWMLGDSGRLLLCVWDPTPWPPVMRAPGVGDEHGRGLMMVDALAARWDWYYPAGRYGGKVVWALCGAGPWPDGPQPHRDAITGEAAPGITAGGGTGRAVVTGGGAGCDVGGSGAGAGRRLEAARR